jgi:hypothetical protein
MHSCSNEFVWNDSKPKMSNTPIVKCFSFVLDSSAFPIFAISATLIF